MFSFAEQVTVPDALHATLTVYSYIRLQYLHIDVQCFRQQGPDDGPNGRGEDINPPSLKCDSLPAGEIRDDPGSKISCWVV